MDLSHLLANPAAIRAVLPGFLASNLAPAESVAHSHERLTTAMQDWTDQDCASLIQHLVELGGERRVYDAHPPARELTRSWARDVLVPAHVEGLQHLQDAADAGPTVIICNHHSYADSNILDAILAWHDAAHLADRIYSAAGPKVYTDLFRRFCAGSVGTLPVPQSNSLGHTESQLSQRELARQAIQSLKASSAALAHGRILLIFAEGSRSRTGRLGPFLQGVSRYLRPEGCRVVPAALVGTERVMGVGSDKLHPGPVTLHLAAAISVAQYGTKEALPAARQAVAELLPEHMKPL